MSDVLLILTDKPVDSDRQVVEQGLADFSAAQAGYRDWRPLVALVRDPVTHQTLGGMIGRTSYGMMNIDLVYLPETLRGQDIGSRLLQMMEQEAARRGCRAGMLTTITFQAPGFYARNGWQEFGRIACDPPGTARVFMTKTLTAAAGQPQ